MYWKLLKSPVFKVSENCQKVFTWEAVSFPITALTIWHCVVVAKRQLVPRVLVIWILAFDLE